MKIKSLIPSLISLGLLGLTSAALAEPTVYGKAIVSLNKYDAEENSVTKEDNWQLNSNASRLGIKGDLALDNNLKAIYQLEYEVAVDDGEHGAKVDADCDDDDTTKDESCKGTGSAFKQRNIFVGIEGKFGQVIAGKHDTPLKLAQGKVDRFNDLVLGDIKEVISGENRADNIVMYTAPKMGAFETMIAFIPGEEKVEDNVGPDKNEIADGVSASLNFKQDAFWVSLAVDSELMDSRLKEYMDIARLTAEYSFDKAKLAVMAQEAEEVDGDIESSAYFISGEYQFADRWTAKAQYSTDTTEYIVGNDDFNLGDEADSSMFTVGADYKLADKAKLFAYASSFEADTDVDAEDAEKTTFGLGTEISF